jgi:hypothetical protein
LVIIMGLGTVAATEGRTLEKEDRRRTRTAVTVTMRIKRQSLLVKESVLCLAMRFRKIEGATARSTVDPAICIYRITFGRDAIGTKMQEEQI